MKRFCWFGMAVLLVVLVAGMAVAADKDMIKSQVDEIVVAIDGGAPADSFGDAAKKEPYYIFIMEEPGKMVVHPTLTGESLKEKAGPVYEELVKATPDGTWVDYEWQGQMKHTYVRNTQNGLIVGSGYSD